MPPPPLDTPDNALVTARPRHPLAVVALLAVVPLVVATMPPVVRAGISAPRSSVVFSADGSRVMVMLSPWPGGDTRPSVPFPDGRAVDLHATFPTSGVYDVRGFKPVWQTGLFALDWDYLCSDDLDRLVIRNRFGTRSGPAVTFYDRGTVTRIYACKDLLRCLGSDRFLPYDTWDWHVDWYDGFDLSPDHRSVMVTTAKRHLRLGVCDLGLGVQEFYSFDFRTGLITRRHSTLVRVIVVDALILLLTAAVTGLVIRWAWRRLPTRRNRRGFPVDRPGDPPQARGATS